MKRFRQALQASEFVVTAAMNWPADQTVDDFLERASVLKDVVAAIVLPEPGPDRPAVSVPAACELLLGIGIDPVPELTGRDRNAIAVASDLLGLRAMGVTSLLAGEALQQPALPSARPGHSPLLTAANVLAVAESLNQEEIEPLEELVTGISLTLAGPPFEAELSALTEYAAAGAQLLLVRPGHDLSQLAAFMQAMVEARQTWNFTTLAMVPAGGIVSDCADYLRELAEIPGVNGACLDVSRDVRQVAEIVRSAGF